MKLTCNSKITGPICGAILLGCILNISMAAHAQDDAQDDAQDEEELAPIVLEDRNSIDGIADSDEFASDDEFASEDLAENEIPETYDEQLQRLFFDYRDAVLGSMFTEADTLAKQIVELSIRVNGLDSRKSAAALTNLAVAQHGMKDYPSAILNYSASIGIIERIEHRLDNSLINPLRGLGASYFESGRPDLARKAFDRAVHISHVNDGPHNLDQIETLLSLTETYLAVGETAMAVDVQKRIFYLQARNIESNSLDMIPALETRASWQHRMSLYEQERYTLRRIINVVESANGKESLQLIQPLTNLANSYLSNIYIGVPAKAQPAVSNGEPYLKRAIRIADRNPDATWQEKVDTNIELADYYIMTDRPGRAHTLYRNAWDILSEDESLFDVRANRLETSIILRDIYVPNKFDDSSTIPTKEEPAGYLEGVLVLSYSVNTRGHATDVRIIEADPRGLDSLYKRIGRELRYIVYRPRLVDGVPTRSDNMIFSHNFFYRPENAPQDEDKTNMVTENAASD
jgi:tetratricopeptide (TPR) repeat protein